MTVATELARSERSWTGVETSFSLGFPAQKPEHVSVTFRDALGALTPLIAGVHYSLSLTLTDGTITPVALPPAPGTLVNRRHTPALQATEFVDGQTHPAGVLEALHDAAALRDAESSNAIADIEATLLAVDAVAAAAAADTAEAWAILARDAANAAIALNPLLATEFTTTTFTATQFIPAARTWLRTAFHLNIFDKGGQLWARAATMPTHKGRFRSVDRFLPNGAIDNTNGGWWEITDRTVLHHHAFGGLSNGITDQRQTIQDAIDALPPEGGEVILSGRARIYAPLTIGNGSSSAIPSTRRDVTLRGEQKPTWPGEGIFVPQNETRLEFYGTLNDPMLYILGPLRGFEIRNIFFDGRNVAGYGIRNIAGSYGKISWSGFQQVRVRSISNEALAWGGNPVVDVEPGCVFIDITDNYFFLPEVANACAIYMDGGGSGGGVGNSNYDSISRNRIIAAATVASYGIIFRIADSIKVDRLLWVPQGLNAGHTPILFDYSGATGFPYNIHLDGVDPGWKTPVARQFLNSGSGAQVLDSNGPNIISNVPQGNGGMYPQFIENVNTGLPMKQGMDVEVIARATDISGTAFVAETVGMPTTPGRYRVNWYMALRTTGTGTLSAVISFDDNIGVKGKVLGSLNAATGGDHFEGTSQIVVKPGTTLSWATTRSGITGTPTFDLYMCFERLN